MALADFYSSTYGHDPNDAIQLQKQEIDSFDRPKTSAT